MHERRRNIFIRNLANIVSILGVLPICILFGEHGYLYLLPLIIYNNFMDDLDGVLAAKLNIRSEIGALLDNVCDAIAHAAFVMIVGMHFAQEAGQPYLGGFCLATSLLATAAMILRVVTRLDPSSTPGTGSPTNELIRHMFFILILAQIFEFNPTVYLSVTFILHAVSMLVPFKMPYLIRSLTKSAGAIALVNVALLVTWMLPAVAPFVAALFGISYLGSFVAGGFRWIRKYQPDDDTDHHEPRSRAHGGSHSS
jgi:phosphatidylserine synthase